MVLVLAQVCIGMIFGSVQTGTTVLATAEGQAGLAGLIHAVLGVGSVIAGLAVTGLPERGRSTRRGWRSPPSACCARRASAAGRLAAVADRVIALLGFAVAPYMISNFALAGILVPVHRVSAAMTLLAGATGIGYAVGSTTAGRLADAGGYGPAFGVTITAAWLALVLAVVAQRVLGRAPQR